LLLWRGQPKGYVILGRTPAYEGQRRHKLIVQHELLYTWLTVKHKSLSLKYVIQREEPDNKTVSVSDECGARFLGSRMVQISEDKSGRPCALIRQLFEKGAVTDPRWDLMVGPGICPCAMICFVAIINKSMGRAARCQYRYILAIGASLL
jgi:hypothetical protein